MNRADSGAGKGPGSGPREVTSPEVDVTEFIKETPVIVQRIVQVLSRAQSRIDVIGTEQAPNVILNVEQYRRALSKIPPASTAPTGRYITEITPQNLQSCKTLMEDLGAEVRHLEGVKSSMVITDSEFAIDLSPPHPDSPATQILYSNSKDLLEQEQQFFETLWDKSVPAEIRIQDLGQTGRQTRTGQTKLTFSVNEALRAADQFAEEMTQDALIVVSRPGGLSENMEFFQKVLSRANSVGARVKLLVNLRRDEIGAAKTLQQRGAEVRVLAPGQQLNLSLGIYDGKNMGLVQYTDPEGGISSQVRGRPVYASAMISTDRLMVGWVAQVFGMLWEDSSSVDDWVTQLEEGRDPPRFDVIRDTTTIQERMLEMIQHAEHEVLFLFPTVNAFYREQKIGAIDALGAAISRGVRGNILAPADRSIIEATLVLSSGGKSPSGEEGAPLRYRRISKDNTHNTVTILVVDRKASLVLEQRDDSSLDFHRAVGVATYSTSNSTVLAMANIFDKMWQEVEMRERELVLLENERRSRKTAQLLQDILSHDIRNYNQIAKLNTEVLRESREISPEERERLFEVIARAIDNSTDLVEKAKKLGRIVSPQKVHLGEMDLEEAIESSLSVVRAANPDKRISVSGQQAGGRLDGKAMVLADDLLGEAITNILSNSVKYTDGPEVRLQVELDEEEKPSSARAGPSGDASADARMEPENPGQTIRGWRLTIADWGRGIPDGTKAGIFNRYLETARGTGLGLSIVRAVIVDRYSGEVSIRNRVQDDYTKGTVVQLWIPEARVTDQKSPAPVSTKTALELSGNSKPRRANPA